jgi:hypothetical protein
MARSATIKLTQDPSDPNDDTQMKVAEIPYRYPEGHVNHGRVVKPFLHLVAERGTDGDECHFRADITRAQALEIATQMVFVATGNCVIFEVDGTVRSEARIHSHGKDEA